MWERLPLVFKLTLQGRKELRCGKQVVKPAGGGTKMKLNCCAGPTGRKGEVP